MIFALAMLPPLGISALIALKVAHRGEQVVVVLVDGRWVPLVVRPEQIDGHVRSEIVCDSDEICQTDGSY